ncbi:MAG: 5-methyltetrahydropteroyltriglutamate--homocysteine S-methyltransferase [Candidatus Eiseniibacteriota bacterium]
MAQKPPFRADHIGSLLRPAELRAAHEQALMGKLGWDALKTLEDKYIRDAVAWQEAIGLHAITDGEFRRTSFHFDFLEQLEGVVGHMPAQYGTAAPAANGEKKPFAPPTLSVTGKVRHVRPILLDAFKFLKSVTRHTPKLTMPSPTMLLRAGRDQVDRAAYPDMEEFHADIATAYRAEIKALADAGCTYIQLDDTNFAYLCDSAMRETLRVKGEDPAARLRLYVRLINAALAERPAGMTVAIHICRGNLQGKWAAEGGYEPVAEAAFGGIAVDGFFLEYDSARAGGFEPLRFMSKGKRAVLGLVSSKLPEMESADALRRRIDEAAKIMRIEDMCLSPQCGFASSYRGNPVSEDIEKQKLALIVKVADQVWGNA